MTETCFKAGQRRVSRLVGRHMHSMITCVRLFQAAYLGPFCSAPHCALACPGGNPRTTAGPTLPICPIIVVFVRRTSDLRWLSYGIFFTALKIPAGVQREDRITTPLSCMRDLGQGKTEHVQEAMLEWMGYRKWPGYTPSLWLKKSCTPLACTKPPC